MADASYKIHVDIGQAQRSLNSLQSSVSNLGAALGAFGLYQISKDLIALGDTATLVKNRLNQLGPALGSVSTQFEAVAQIAINSRTPLEATGDLYFRIARSANDLGISARDAAEMTDTIAKAISSSGLSAAEARGPLIQFGQALQSGRLQGDELRSILEGLPPVANALAKYLGVPVGQLRMLGAQGKLTGETLVKAMQASRDSILEGFGKTVPTVAQSFEVLKTKISLAVNKFMESEKVGQTFSKVFDGIANIINKIVDNADVLASTIKKLLGIFLAFTAAKIVMMFFELSTAVYAVGKNLFVAAAGAKALSLALVRSGIGAIIVLLGGKLGEMAFDSLFASDSFGQLGTSAEELKGALDNLETAKGPGLTDAQRYPEVAQAVAKLRGELENLIATYKLSNDESIKQLQLDTQTLALGEQQAAQLRARSRAEIEYNQKLAELKAKINNIDKDEKANDYERAQLKAEVNRQIQELTAAYEEHLPVLEATVSANIAAQQAERLRSFGLDQQIDLQRQLRQIQDDTARLTLTTLERKYFDLEQAARESAESQIAEFAKLNKINRDAVDPKIIDEYYTKAFKGLDRLKRVTKENYDQSRTWATGWKRAFNEYVEAATDASAKAERFFSKAVTGMEDMIVNFVKTGKFEWKEFVSSMVEELFRSQLQTLMAQLFKGLGLGDMFGAGSTPTGAANNPLYVVPVGSMGSGLLGGAGSVFSGNGPNQGGGNIFSNILSGIGNIFGGGGRTPDFNPNPGRSSSGSILGGIGSVLGSIGSGIGSLAGTVVETVSDLFGGFFANGGMLGAGKWGIAGENGPELITGPASISPLGGSTSVVYNINAVDAASFKSLVARDPGFIHAVAMQGAKAIPGRYS